METFEQALDAEWAVMRELIITRQGKYGPDNITAGGVHGLITRMQDKLARIKQDHKDCTFLGDCVVRDLPDENPNDAWLDLAAYSGFLAMMLLHGTWGLPLEEDSPMAHDPSLGPRYCPCDICYGACLRQVASS